MVEENRSQSPEPQSGTLGQDAYEAEDVFENAEPWSPIETKIVLASFGAAILALVVFGYLINAYILN